MPVKVFSASESANEVHLRQLHRECHSPINYRKTCPTHGELTQDQIISGYEYQKDRFVIVDADELEHLRTSSEKAINIDGFIGENEIDPIYYSGKNYYLLPDGLMGATPYALLRQAMVEERRVAMAKVFWFGREHLVILRPVNRLIVMATLNYPGSIREPKLYEGDLPETELSEEHVKLARSLLSETTLDDFDIASYKDRYQEAFHELVRAKLEGKEIVAPPEIELPRFLNLMEALKRSLDGIQSRNGNRVEVKRKRAPSIHRVERERKKKSG